jgi:hypothetical protein
MANEELPTEQEEEKPPSTIEMKLREKKQLPSVKYLLEHGDPDSPPPTLKDTVQLMLALTATFIGSLIVWHYLFLRDSTSGKTMDGTTGRDEM